MAIKVTEVTPTRYYATLSYRGASFDVFGENGWQQEWPSYREALRAADDYRANRWHKPSDEVLAWWDAKANELVMDGGWH